MTFTTKIIKTYNIFFLLCLFVLEIAVANDKAQTSNQVALHKITHSPIIKFLQTINNVSEYTMSHLDYFADECKYTVINKAPFFSILIAHYFLASFLDVKNSESILYSAFTLLSISLLFSWCNTLMTPKELMQRISILFYGFYKYIFPIYSLTIISDSYTAKLGRNGYIPTFLLSLATLGPFILSNNNKDPFIENIPLLVINNHLPITPLMSLIKKTISYPNTKNDIFVYAGSLELDDKDNLISMLYKWTALHTDDISLELFRKIVVDQATKIPEIAEQATSVYDPFYNNPLLLEYCLQVNNLQEKCRNYQGAIIDNHQTLILTHKDLNLSFIKLKVTDINSNSLIHILNFHKAIVVESLNLNFTLHETITSNKYRYFSVIKNKDIYYLFFSLDTQNKNNFNLRTVGKFLKLSLWSLLSSINCFSLNNCLIVKIYDINNLKEILTSAIKEISYTTCLTHVYTSLPEKNMKKKYHLETNNSD